MTVENARLPLDDETRVLLSRLKGIADMRSPDDPEGARVLTRGMLECVLTCLIAPTCAGDAEVGCLIRTHWPDLVAPGLRLAAACGVTPRKATSDSAA